MGSSKARPGARVCTSNQSCRASTPVHFSIWLEKAFVQLDNFVASYGSCGVASGKALPLQGRDADAGGTCRASGPQRTRRTTCQEAPGRAFDPPAAADTVSIALKFGLCRGAG